MSIAADHPLVQALHGVRAERTPVWFMGQSRLRLTEQLALLDGRGILESSVDPELAADLTLQPVRRLGVDGAVFFSSIVVPLALAGVDVEIVPGRGPVVAELIRSPTDVLRLPMLDPEVLAPIREGVALAVAELGSTPLIAIAGAPYTLASYLIEGGPSRDHLRTRTMMYAEPHAWAGLLNWCADVSGEFLRAQIDSGASVAQLVDPALGSLSRGNYFTRVAPHSQRALSHLRGSSVPIVHFGPGTGDYLDLMAGVGADAVGVDWRVQLDEAARRVGPDVALQGNIDPALLSVPWRILRAHVDDVLERGRSASAHVANLGHGAPPDADADVLARIVRVIHGEEPLD